MEVPVRITIQTRPTGENMVETLRKATVWEESVRGTNDQRSRCQSKTHLGVEKVAASNSLEALNLLFILWTHSLDVDAERMILSSSRC